jgi:hypothetical protein
MAILLRQNTDANNFLDAAGIARTQANAPIIIGICQLTSDLKQYGIWDKMKAVYPMVGQAGVSSSFQFNLKNPSLFKGTFSGSWTFSSTGATPDGTSAYMDTNFSPSASLGPTNNHFMIYLRNVSLPTKNITDFGAFTDDYNSRFGTNYYSNPTFDTTNFDVQKRTVVSNSLIGSGFALYSRSANNLAKVYYNNSLIATDTSTTVSYPLPNITVTLGALHLGTTTVAYSDRQNSFTTIGDSLTDTEAANFYTAVQRFQTTLGRQV